MDYEAYLLKLMIDSFPEEDRARVVKQLSMLDFVQRSPDRKILAFFQLGDTYFRHWENVLLEDRSVELPVFQATLHSDQLDKREVKVSVIFHQGRISSMEFNRPFKL